MRILRNLAALAVVLVIGTACQGDLTAPEVTVHRNPALAGAPVSQSTPRQTQQPGAPNKAAKPASRYAMAAN